MLLARFFVLQKYTTGADFLKKLSSRLFLSTAVKQKNRYTIFFRKFREFHDENIDWVHKALFGPF